MSARVLLTLAFCFCALSARNARAEVITLLDNEQLSGRIIHYYDGVFHIELSTGQKTEIPQTKIKTITFKLPPARPEFAAPDKTFARWKDAIAKQDMNKFIDSLSLMQQAMMAATIQDAGPEQVKQFWKQFEGVKLDVKSTKTTGNTSIMKLQRSHGDDVDTFDLHLVLENGEWKVLMPQ